MELQFDCPACGQQALLLGVRWDRLHRWCPWIIRGTPLYLCTRCDAVVAAAPAEAVVGVASSTTTSCRFIANSPRGWR